MPLVALAACLVTLLVAPSANAIPAFARKYQTSCQTCHIAFPRLTPFGEAFRRNAYRFPEGGDAEAQKTEPVALGNDAMKDLWPNSVYSGELPGSLPFSLMMSMKAQAGTKFEGMAMAPSDSMAGTGMSGMTDQATGFRTRFTDIGGNARFLAGGSLGPFGGFFAAISFENSMAPELERGFVVFTPFDQTSFNIKVGRFDPSLHGVSIHRSLLGHQLRLTTTSMVPGGFMPEHALKGIELSGLILGRIGWFAGLVENEVPVVDEIDRDYYGRLELKVGGMRLDGRNAQAGSAAWREMSFTLGASGYHGRQTVPDNSMPGMAMAMHEGFQRGGVDVHAVIGDLMVDAVGVLEQHNSALVTGQPATMNLEYVEVTYMTFPWIFPSVRFERSEVVGPGASFILAPSTGTTTETAVTTDVRGVHSIALGAISTVIRPNVLLRGEVGVGADPGERFQFRMAALETSVAF